MIMMKASQREGGGRGELLLKVVVERKNKARNCRRMMSRGGDGVVNFGVEGDRGPLTAAW